MEEFIMSIDIPLISPVSRKYYDYANEKSSLKHHRAEDVRICLEYICDEIIVEFVSETDRKNWEKYDLHSKLKASRSFLDKDIVDKLIDAKIVGNKGVHTGEEGNYSETDIEKSIDSIKEFSLNVFLSYFRINGFGIQRQAWIPTVFSTLPPIYRVHILEEYYKCDPSTFVIDKLSKAYLKSGLEDKAINFLHECYDKKEITDLEYADYLQAIDMLKQNLHVLPIAKDLESAKNNFNNLLPAIEEEKRDSFVCLVSMILNGYHPQNMA